MSHPRTLHGAALLLCPLLFLGADCGGGASFDYRGSIWSYRLLVLGQDIQAGGRDFPHVSWEVRGRWRVAEEPRSDSENPEFDLLSEVSSAKVKYVLAPEEYGYLRCEGVGGMADATASFRAGMGSPGNYTRFYDQVATIPAFNMLWTGASHYPRHHAVSTWIQPIDPDTLPDAFPVECVDIEDGTSHTQYRGVPYLAGGILYSGPLATGTTHRTETNSSGARWTTSLTLTCVSGCEGHYPEDPVGDEPLPHEPDVCDPASVRSECAEFKVQALEMCSRLEDWTVVETTPAGTEVTCADADCSGAIARNEARNLGPWIGASWSTDVSCSGNAAPETCSIECFGWGGEQ
ncbi:MAG: hypothetical protein IT285_14975 [Bdellovibrionales bacterium]|nr:hypothetical protein [Bdellovibrionales bacterium]